ncbi:FAS1 domain-containing protein [Cristinia sonorae]|uniref:FAS1 domain-containing protein n=1 Tax=Cristinia sonorae TaxID=1940300 RepID=A0A8K0XVE7_9AGAR|nr:FAS1 domain-containing protein [Cristinia sonorae]
MLLSFTHILLAAGIGLFPTSGSAIPAANPAFLAARNDQEPLGATHFPQHLQEHDSPAYFTSPHGPPHDWNPDASGKTIYQFLKEDEHFTRLFKLVNFTTEITNTLNDSSASLTLFAPPDFAFRPPKHAAHHCDASIISSSDFEDCFLHELKERDPVEALGALEDLVAGAHADTGKKKEIIKKIVGAILSYHILPHSLARADLAKNTTFATSYAPIDGAFDGKPLRIHVEPRLRLLKPTLVVNFYASVVKADIQAKNGLVHVINHPILPPPAAFQELFLFSDHFSTFTSAIQRTGITNATDWRYMPSGDKKWTAVGAPSVTVFAPTNAAFTRLPWKLQFFLFSPIGERVLGKLLQFHIVPDHILHSDYFHNATASCVSHTPACFDDRGLDDTILFDLHQQTYATLGHALTTKLAGAGIRQFLQSHRTASTSSGPRGLSINRFGMLTDAATNEVVGFQPDFDPHSCTRGVVPPHGPHQVYSHSGYLPTLLTNHTLYVELAQYEHPVPIPPHHPPVYSKKFVVQGVPVKLLDVPARNGAIHVIDKVLNPRGKKDGHHGHGPDSEVPLGPDGEWEGWEDWLVKWAEGDSAVHKRNAWV